MTQDEYIALYERYLSGQATTDEVKLLITYEDQFDIRKFDDNTPIPDQEQIRQRIFAQIERRKNIPRSRRSVVRLWWPVAASILILLAASLILSHRDTLIVKPKSANVTKGTSHITPGTTKAILILGNGGQINLNAMANGRIAQAGNTVIKKINNGQLVYENNSGQKEISYNTIVTPRGGQYQVTLPDGTEVWLNAASSLKYPTAFVGRERHVDLTGEAYFEVAKNKHMPFTVSAGKVNVKVLGTHFNISAYEDDPANKTTLLEGSIELSKNGQLVLLTPGQQAVAGYNSEQIQLKSVNVDDAVAWKNGYFSFRKENIKSAMRRIARWYDVDIEFQGEVSNKYLGGSVSRAENIDEMLSYLQLTGIANFNIKERRIIVKGN